MNSVSISNQTKSKINTKELENITVSFLKNFKVKKREVSIAIVGDKVIRGLNKQYRGQDKITDVLAFPGESGFLGEILISWPQIKRQAKHFSDSTRAELIFILIHGLLHLLGHDDSSKKGKEEMIRMGEKFINLYLKKTN